MSAKKYTLGIDATNLRRGGGRTHLIELLHSMSPLEYNIHKVIVWGGKETLASLDNREWLNKINPSALDGNIIQRTLWQRFSLSQAARDENCDILLVPGGSYSGNFKPVVTMCRNMLPFEWKELKRYGWSLFTFKLLLLRLTQMRTFKKSDGVIFLTKYAQNIVLDAINTTEGKESIIPHGLNSRFNIPPRSQKNIEEFSKKNPYRIIYVSIIDEYKHQWHVVEAVSIIRKQGLPVVLDLVGPANPAALIKFNKAIVSHDPKGEWVNYHGAIPFNELHVHYEQADLGLFASSCENMPNILLETMTSGLPIACSNQGPMPEILGNAGIYFDPEQPKDIAYALNELIQSSRLRAEKSQESFQLAQNFSWNKCSDETLNFLEKIAIENR